MSNITKYNKLNTSLFDMVNQWHDSFWADPFFQLERNWRPTDVKETDNSYIIEVELPRFTRDQIRVQVDDNKLSIDAKNERSHYTRTFSVSNVDFEKSEVSLENGVLTITSPKQKKNTIKVLDVKEPKQLK